MLDFCSIAPSVVQNLRSIIATFDSVTLMWDDLSCVDRNGGLSGYRVQYGISSLTNAETATGTTFTVTGLSPSTTYVFRVAGFNDALLLPDSALRFSSSVSQGTTLPSGKPVLALVAQNHLKYYCSCRSTFQAS